MKLQSKQFTTLFIKPDALKDGVDETIINEFIQAGFKIKYREKVEITYDQSVFIYKDHVGNPNFLFAINSLINDGECLSSIFLIVKLEEGDALLRAQELKGKADENGIRAKYRRYHWTNLDAQGIEGDERKSLLSRNRIHVPDTNEHVSQIINLLVDKQNLDIMESADNEFKIFLESYRHVYGVEENYSKGKGERL